MYLSSKFLPLIKGMLLIFSMLIALKRFLNISIAIHLIRLAPISPYVKSL